MHCDDGLLTLLSLQTVKHALAAGFDALSSGAGGRLCAKITRHLMKAEARVPPRAQHDCTRDMLSPFRG